MTRLPVGDQGAVLRRSGPGSHRNQPEPALWRVALLARPAAAEALRPVIAVNPTLAGFLAPLPAAGYLPASVIDELLPSPRGEKSVNPPALIGVWETLPVEGPVGRLIPDLRGHGGSGRRSPFTVDGYLGDALAVLDASVERAHLVGAVDSGSRPHSCG